ncbi:expressed unknown protein [Seminavis robusta]|uniref:Uncharacterized protein n=1 Tax=Seminavis robusta TaxID=568900 RepID=A0A9N8HQL6_9STRA|nr:expressed unknown protein [Seminavis robusta]|eukprot:Sro1178_g249470.1 n/a (368) ;mRNA; r:5449-6552
MATAASVSPLHSFFASNFPLLRQQKVEIVSDNPGGLSRTEALSERRRLYDAHQQRLGDLFVTPPASSPVISRWESEVPDLMTIPGSPPQAESRPTCSSAMIPQPIGPKIPRRRSSLEEFDEDGYCCINDDATASTAASTTIHSRESNASISSRDSEPSDDRPSDRGLVPPRRRSSCFGGWHGEEVEANEPLLACQDDSQIPSTRLHSRRFSREQRCSSDRHLMLEKKSLHEVKSTKKTDRKEKSSTRSSRRGTKQAPRRPRRMKSMEIQDDSLTSVTLESSCSSVGYDDDCSLRLVMSDSIHTVLQHVKPESPPTSPASGGQMKLLTASEQLLLNDHCLKGVVGALRRNSQQQSPEQGSKPVLTITY